MGPAGWYEPGSAETKDDEGSPRWWVLLLPFAGCLAAGVLAVGFDRLF